MMKERAMVMARALLTDFYLVRRDAGWHYGSSEFYHSRELGSEYAFDQALEWERYENGQLVATSHDTQAMVGIVVRPQAPGIEKGEREPLWWERESAERHAQLVKLIELRNEVRDLIRFGEL